MLANWARTALKIAVLLLLAAVAERLPPLQAVERALVAHPELQRQLILATAGLSVAGLLLAQGAYWLLRAGNRPGAPRRPARPADGTQGRGAEPWAGSEAGVPALGVRTRSRSRRSSRRGAPTPGATSRTGNASSCWRWAPARCCWASSGCGSFSVRPCSG